MFTVVVKCFSSVDSSLPVRFHKLLMTRPTGGAKELFGPRIMADDVQRTVISQNLVEEVFGVFSGYEVLWGGHWEDSGGVIKA